MVKDNRLYNRIEPFSACPVFGSQHCTRAYTAIGDPARQPGIPQPWYWHGTVRQGSVRFNLSEEATPSSPLDVHTLWVVLKVMSGVLGFVVKLVMLHGLGSDGHAHGSDDGIKNKHM